MKHTSLLVMMLAMAALGSSIQATVVWQTDCSALSGWGEASNATNEAGATSGGIQTVIYSGVTLIQMNSWWGTPTAGWTNMWINTGVLIQPNAQYTLTLRMISYADDGAGAGKPVTVSLQNASITVWRTIYQEAIKPALNTWADRTISFSTVDGANAGEVGGQLAIAISPDWWNNMGIDSITLDETSFAGPNDPSPANDSNPNDNLNAVGEPSTAHPGKLKVQLAWDTMEDPNLPGVVYSRVTKHYLYFRANDPNFVGMTPVEIPAGSPIIARPTYLADNLDYSGIYYWQVKESIDNSGPTDSATVSGPIWAFETIQEGPVVVTSPADILVAEGAPAAFTAEVISTTAITCKWYLSGDKANNTSSDDTLLSTTSVSNFTITSTPMSYAGKYVYCVVSNSSPLTASSQPALLEVKRLIGWWSMDSSLADASGNSWNGVYSLPTVTYAAGRIGNALSLSSDPNHVTIVGSEDAFNFYHLGMTVSAWVKSSTPAWGTVLSKEDRTGTYLGWELILNGEGHPAFSVVGGGPSSNAAALNVCDGQWHMLTGVYDPATRIASVYIDGALASSGSAGTSVPLPSPAPVFIGALLENGNTPFSGLVDDARIYTYAKPNTEVLDLYNAIADPDKNLCIKGYGSAGDINGDCKVDLGDFAVIAANWLSCGLYPVCP